MGVGARLVPSLRPPLHAGVHLRPERMRSRPREGSHKPAMPQRLMPAPTVVKTNCRAVTTPTDVVTSRADEYPRRSK